MPFIVLTRWNETIMSVLLQKWCNALFNTCPSVLPQLIVDTVRDYGAAQDVAQKG